MIGVEIQKGTILFVDGQKCLVFEQDSCNGCAVKEMTKNKVNFHGKVIQCGVKGINTSDFLCSAEERSDKTNIIFKPIAR